MSCGSGGAGAPPLPQLSLSSASSLGDGVEGLGARRGRLEGIGKRGGREHICIRLDQVRQPGEGISSRGQEDQGSVRTGSRSLGRAKWKETWKG